MQALELAEASAQPIGPLSRQPLNSRLRVVSSFEVFETLKRPHGRSDRRPQMAESRLCGRQVARRIPAIQPVQITTYLLKLDDYLDRQVVAGCRNRGQQFR